MKKFVKNTVKFFLVCILVFAACDYLLVPKRPKEAALIQNFNEHRIAFEQLRDMLQADTNLSRVASWGVQTYHPFFLGYPSATNFPTRRFLKYAALLQEANGYVGVRSDGTNADVGVVVWSRGFAGDIKHIWIYWMNKTPTNSGDFVCKRIDQNWYVVSD